MDILEDDYLAHYGILRRSGRYPWGTTGWGEGEDPQMATNKSFLATIDAHRKNDGWTEKQIADFYGFSTTQLRAAKSIAKNEVRQEQIRSIKNLTDKGWGNVAIGKRLGLNESTVRSLKAAAYKDDNDVLTTVSNMLRDQVADKKYIDVGAGVEYNIGVSKNRLSTAVAILREEGYEVHSVPVRQVGTGFDTQVKVLAPPGTTWGDIRRSQDQIQQIDMISKDNGRTNLGIYPPKHLRPSEVDVVYKEDGGNKADGVIYIRPGIKKLDIGPNTYAQVRIAVGEDKYLKGMAVYKDDLPEGVNVQFNTNKSKSEVKSKLDVMKDMKRTQDGKIDMANPFGATIKPGGQIVSVNGKGEVKVESVMNIVNDEGTWSGWSNSLSSQVLSKQNPSLARSQLGMTYERRAKEFDEISKLTNPTVRKKLLETFGDETDSAAVHLQAAVLSSRQQNHVIIPVNSLKDTEVYAPNYRNGEQVVLIRHPHAGRFEIPELTVNNANREGRKTLGQARDAIGINANVAQRLSGADFDGDSVIVIPNNGNKIKSAKALDGLKNFDARSEYPGYSGMKAMDSRMTQQKMGEISNLITDMTIRGAPMSEMTRAVKHSMVVIDAEKHKLDYKLSEQNNGIKQLSKKYQIWEGSKRGGASTLISRAGSEVRIPEREPRRASKGGPIDKDTGRRVYEETGRTYPDKKGKTVVSTTKIDKLALTNDPFSLMSSPSGTPMERIYAEHSAKLKDLANKARKESVNTPRAAYSPSAAKAYTNEVKSLKAKLSLAKANAPKERQAQIVANTIVRQQKANYPEMDNATLKKISGQALNEARARTGAGKQRVDVIPKEWEAIQAGAISDSMLGEILRNTDVDKVKEYATPKRKVLMTSAKTKRAQDMLNSGYTRAEVAEALGVSLSTLDNAILD